MKPENIMYNYKTGETKIGDLGLSKQYNQPTNHVFTDYVSTRWY